MLRIGRDEDWGRKGEKKREGKKGKEDEMGMFGRGLDTAHWADSCDKGLGNTKHRENRKRGIP